MTNPTDGRITSLATAASLSATDLFAVVSPGNAAFGVNFKLPYSLLATSIASTILPPNGATGSIYFGQGLSSAPSFILVSGDVLFTNNTAIATSTITTHAVTFAKMQQVVGLSVVGVAGTATADLAAITGTTDQVLRVASNGTTLGFGAINLTAAALTGVMPVSFGGTNTSTLTQAGILFGNGTLTIGITAAGGTALPLVAAGGTAAPTFSVLTVPGGGTGTTTLIANRVLVGAGTSTIASTNIATTGLALVGNGTSAVPGFAILGVPGGGLGTGTTTPFTVLIGGTTATSQVQSVATTGASGLVLTSQGSAAVPIFAAAGAGTVTNIATQAGITGGPITTNGTTSLDGNYFGWALQNCTIAASVGSNILTVAIKDNSGVDPSASSPCNINYRNVTTATGSTTLVQQTAALSITTNATGATLGSSNSVPFRFWVVVFNNGGTNVLALINCSTANSVFSISDNEIASTTPISGSATSAGVFYTPNGTTITSKAYRIIGYIEYGAGLTTAGTYASGPTIIQTLGAGIKLPGETVQIQRMATTTNTQINSVTFTNTLVTKTITPKSAVNLVRVAVNGNLESEFATANVGLRVSRNGAAVVGNSVFFTAGVSSSFVGISSLDYDAPATTSAQAYFVQINGDSVHNADFPTGTAGSVGSIILEEIQG